MRGRDVQFGQGSLEGATAIGSPRPFTLRSTFVDAEVAGFAARVRVTQEFTNPFTAAVEAVYVFPLPDNAAVDDMTLIVGERVIKGVVKRRDLARRDYEQAKSQGRHAALLDEERPNIFTQSIANIQPGETIKVNLQYAQALKYDDGYFEFNFPMTVGPRYIPGAAVSGEPQGAGVSPDTDRVLDASRITPPTLPPGVRSGRDIAVTIHIDAGVPIQGLTSASHRLELDRPSTTEALIQLAPDEKIPNKDLIVRYKVAGPELRSALLTHRGPGGGYFALLVQPESEDSGRTVVPKEMMFIIDTSCSMTGAPLAAEKVTMRKAISAMNPDDTFMLIDFADQASSFHPTPLLNTPQNVQRALSYLDSLPAAGGTNQLDGIRAALVVPPDPKRLRTVLLLTDGFIGNEQEIFAETQRVLGQARIFSVGIGTSVNHFFLSRLAELGRGFYQYVRPDEDSTAAIERFRRRIAKPLITDIEIDWRGLAVSELLPSKLPDLFDNQPFVVLGKYSASGDGTVVVHGRTGTRERQTRVDVRLPDREPGNDVLGSMWARAKIEELERRQYGGERGEVVRQITSLGVEHRLVTRYTSFVAVDATPPRAPAPTTAVTEASEMPDLDTFGEDRPAPRHHAEPTINLIDPKNGGTAGGIPLQGALGLGSSGPGSGGGGLTGHGEGNPPTIRPTTAREPKPRSVSRPVDAKDGDGTGDRVDEGELGGTVGGISGAVIARTEGPTTDVGRTTVGSSTTGEELEATPPLGIAGEGRRATTTPDDHAGKGGKNSTIYFEDLTVNGQLSKPEGDYQLTRRDPALRSLIKERGNFNDKIGGDSGGKGKKTDEDFDSVFGASATKSGDAVASAPATPASRHGSEACSKAKETFLHAYTARSSDPALAIHDYKHVLETTSPSCEYNRKAQRQLEDLEAAAGPSSTLSLADITRIVAQHRSEALACVRKFQQEKPEAHGSITMQWTISGGGHVTNAHCVSTEYQGSVLDTCLATQIRTWQFPSFAGPPQVVPLPFKF